MFGFLNVTTNAAGIPYLRTSGVTVGTDAVDLALGFRRIPAVGLIAVNVGDAIPADATGTLPVRLTLNGNSRVLTFFGGTSVTAADLAGTGTILVWYDWYSGTVQLVSLLAPTA